jgi:hypothetical protein
MMVGYLSGHTCGDACWNARDLICHCSCGGRNHGIFSRGGNQPERTARIGGSMYRLVETGFYGAIEKRRMDETRACGHDWYYDPNGPWIKKTATQTQLKNWPEFQAFAESKEAPYGLWQKIVV